jgi:hypothetical protein
MLGHIVSCPDCLDVANRLLDLPLLSERYPTDMLGPDTRGGKGGSNTPGGGPPGGGNAAAMREAVKRHRRGVRKVFEHRPKELCVTVNGYPLGSQRIGLELNELTLSVKGEEKIEFVEIVSEQETRLLLLNVNEPPPSGLYEQTEQVALSDGRMLEARLSFSNPWPTLHIVYSDPTLKPETSNSFADFDVDALASAPIIEQENSPGLTNNWPLKGFALRLWRGLADWRFWLRPGSITAIFATLLIVAMLFMQMRTTTPARVSPVELLQRSTATDEALSLAKDYTLHRTIALEERRGMGGEIVAQRRLEIWHSAEKGITARRLYNEQNRLVAGEWTRADGSQTLYQHGTQSRFARQRNADNLRGLDDVWLLELSAQDFTRLIGRADQAQVEVAPDAYIINYQSVPDVDQGSLIKATLVLNKADLHAIEQTLTVRQDGALRQYRLIETGFEQRPKDKVAADVFEPEPELLGPATTRTDLKSKLVQAEKESIESGEPQPLTKSTATASPELEVEVTYLLDQIKANLGEQVDLKRTRAGTLRVQAIIETEQRKAEILQTLSPVAGNPAVEVQVETIAEALKRQTQLPSSEITVREIEVAKNPFPAYAEVSRYFSDVNGLSGEQREAAVRSFASGILSKSRQAMSHAWALKQLARRFSSEELAQLDPEARAKWLFMVRAHAQAFRQETVGLRQALEPIFFRSATGRDAGDESALSGATDLSRAAEQLFELGSTQERAIRFAFTTSPGAAMSSVINSRQLWQSLRSAEMLAARIQSALPK